MSVEIIITTSVFPTEAEQRVRDAVQNIFPDAKCEMEKEIMAAKAHDLKQFSTKLKDQRIRDSARSVLRRSIAHGRIEFNLNKQAALAGKVNFTEGDSILGDIVVRIDTGEPEELIDLLTRKKEREDDR